MFGPTIALISAPVLAQSLDANPDSKTAPVQTHPAPQLPVELLAQSNDPYSRYDALAMRGWERSLPKTGDTVLGDGFGIRDALADKGVGFLGFASNSLVYNIRNYSGRYRGPQLYNGQRLTRSVTALTLFLTYDLGRAGVEGGQFIMSAYYTSNNFHAVNGPSFAHISRLAYYQSLLDRKFEFKIGIFDNAFEFLGTQTGGSFAGGTLGPQASVPNEVGLSYGGIGTPTANFRINLKNHFYNKFGIQRSLPPGGATPEIAANPVGLRLRVPGTGVLMINELGWDRPAQAGLAATWVRFGGIYNTTYFPRYGRGEPSDNWAAYLALDRQLDQIDPSKPARGVYVGATFNYAPPHQNFISQYYETRVYGVGLLRDRPFDLASIVATANVYSKSGLAARTLSGQASAGGTFGFIGTYAYRLKPGLYLQPGVGVVVHPIYSPSLPVALNTYLQITLFL